MAQYASQLVLVVIFDSGKDERHVPQTLDFNISQINKLEALPSILVVVWKEVYTSYFIVLVLLDHKYVNTGFPALVYAPVIFLARKQLWEIGMLSKLQAACWPKEYVCTLEKLKRKYR